MDARSDATANRSLANGMGMIANANGTIGESVRGSLSADVSARVSARVGAVLRVDLNASVNAGLNADLSAVAGLSASFGATRYTHTIVFMGAGANTNGSVGESVCAAVRAIEAAGAGMGRGARAA